uniref:A kinase (PRKA) anchor protein 9 n=1 Tax=Amphiprion percula TaxID=161767 RepID=A0A3P8SFL9_AMPPE
MEEKDREIALLNEQITKLQHMETASDNKVTLHLIKDLESQVECLRSEQERLKRNNEEELDQLNAVIDKLQQELANIEQKQPPEEDEDTKDEPENDAWRPSKEEYDEMKQRMDQATKELETLKTEHSKLLETYLRLKESAEALAETEKLESSEGELEEVLREKTAGLVVMQAQVQALEQSATSRVEELGLRIQQLEDLVAEKDSEISHCRLLLEQAKSSADGLQQKVSNLEENLREKVAAALVSQATLEAFQQQQSVESRQEQDQDLQRRAEPLLYNFGDFGIPKLDFSAMGQAKHVPTGKVVCLTQKLRELEVGLNGIQKDQELQKQLLSSSEEEVVEYEKRLAVLMDLLSQMKAKTHKKTSSSLEKRGLDHQRAARQLQGELQQTSGGPPGLIQELEEVRHDAASTKEELSSYREQNEKLQEDLRVSEFSSSKLKEELEEVRKSVDTTKEELSSYKQHNEKLHEELHSRELSISKLKEELQEVRTEKLCTFQPEVEEVIGEFEEKIVQMQELHAAEILDMEARHISESENLRRDTQALEDECKALKFILFSTCVLSLLPIFCILLHESFCHHADSSSDYSQRTGYDLPSLQQEFRTTPEGARRETDDALPDRIKTLLREVHQEGMQVLSLSELPLSEGEPSGQFNIQGWMKERDALLATVESLKKTTGRSLYVFLYSLQMPGGVDWRGELLDAVRQVFARERSVLKHALYSRLDLLDTSDAIIHLNQLERRLAEQVSSNNSDINLSILCRLGVQPGLSLAGECSMKEGGGAVEVDRLLVEELKSELSQTKLELETTLKAQHKHLKELDTLRAEVSQKAAEVDALNDHLTEERKKSRDLQWTMEKEKCRTGRSEESKREELEDLHMVIEEQKNHVAHLNQTLVQERQASSQFSQQAEQERLGLHRRLQELQVQLETERAKAQEMSTALGRERELRTGVQEDGRSLGEEGSLLERLQRELDDKHAQVGFLWILTEFALLEARAQLEREASGALQAGGQSVSQTSDTIIAFKCLFSSFLILLFHEAIWQSESTDRTKDWVFQQKSGNVHPGSSTTSPQVEVSPAGLSSGLHHGPWRTVDKIVGKLHLISSKIRSMSTLHVVVTAHPCVLLQSVSLLAGGSSSSSNTLTERLLRQNAELTGFVSRLTEEKNDLRNHTLRLEEELRRYRQAGLGSGDRTLKMDSAGMMFSQEREAWTREKFHLEKALHLAQSQVARLRGEIRSETLREITGPEADNRMYGKYLRSESFRKALIYQKKYLLLLLGGFQECEEATLTLLSRMGSRPSLSSLESLSKRRRGLMRFRSAVRVSIALSRMRFLVKRWHKATGMSSTTSCSINKNGTGQTLGNQSSSCFLAFSCFQFEMVLILFISFRFRGEGLAVSSSRQCGDVQRKRECRRRRRNLQQYHLAGDHGPLTCSHLQSYDPDRALTDYISRLEALQRRLGSVTSGSASSYAQLHFGLRR